MDMKLEWIITEPAAQCGEPRKRGSVIICELPWDHICVQDNEPARMVSHMGRSRTGAWHSWE